MRSIILLALLCAPAFAQSLTPTKVNVTSGYTNPKVVGPYLLHGDFSKPASRPGVLLTIEPKDATQKLFDLYAEAIPSLEIAELQSLPDGTALLVGEGRFRVTAFFENPSAVKRLTVELGPPAPPEPDPEPPKPDVVVPADPFDNIGQRVAGWAKGLPKTREVALLYVNCAEEMVGSTKTINACIETMVKARTELLKPEELKLYQPLIDQLNADLKKRWPMAAMTCASYFNAIAAGLAGAK